MTECCRSYVLHHADTNSGSPAQMPDFATASKCKYIEKEAIAKRCINSLAVSDPHFRGHGLYSLEVI